MSSCADDGERTQLTARISPVALPGSFHLGSVILGIPLICGGTSRGNVPVAAIVDKALQAIKAGSYPGLQQVYLYANKADAMQELLGQLKNICGGGMQAWLGGDDDLREDTGGTPDQIY